MPERTCAVCGGPITGLQSYIEHPWPQHVVNQDCVAHVRAEMRAEALREVTRALDVGFAVRREKEAEIARLLSENETLGTKNENLRLEIYDLRRSLEQARGTAGAAGETQIIGETSTGSSGT